VAYFWKFYARHHKTIAEESKDLTDLELTPETPHPMEIMQLTGAICTEQESYRPGLWIVLRDNHVPPNQSLSPALVERVEHYADETRPPHGPRLTTRQPTIRW